MKTAIKSMLYLNGVNKTFDGFKAINNLCLDITPGELRAIIGPNGAGKSTMMDIITGKTKPDQGDVRFKDDIDLTQFDETTIANMGIGRKFQKPTVIETLTVFENMELAIAGDRHWFQSMFMSLTEKQKNKIDAVITQVGLCDKTQAFAGSMSHGKKQRLEIGMLIVQEPEVLLVDEPAGGMTDEETMETARMLKEVSQQHSVIVVEHDMQFVKALDCKVTVLHEGSVIAEGDLDTVSSEPRVIEVYLGR